LHSEDLRTSLYFIPLALAKNLTCCFEYEISYTSSGGFTTLHRIKEPELAQFVDEMFAVPLPRDSNRLSLHESRQFNQFLEQQDASSVKCPPTDLDFSQETNRRHQQMRLCRDSLRDKIGWRLPRGDVLSLHPDAQTLLASFFLTHMQPPNATFLDTLFDTPWTEAQYSSYETAICGVRTDTAEVMAPFWAEYFDVASVRVGTDSKNLFIGQYDKLFEEYWLSPISYLSPYRG
jgi:hypothetical protein